MTVAPTLRLNFIDASRTYAIFLALLAHVLTATGTFATLGDDSRFITQFTHMATPMFVFMFGFMVEFIYASRARVLGVSSQVNRLFVRSFQCYMAYALTTLCAYLGDFKSFQGLLASLVFFGDSRFGNILRAYSVMLLITPMILWLRFRLGVWALYLSLIAVMVLSAYVPDFKSIDFGAFDHPVNILLGVGPAKGGPSVLGCFCFYFSGMIVASSVVKGQDFDKAKFFLTIFSLACLMIFFWVVFLDDAPSLGWQRSADFSYRLVNSIGYYIIGVLCSLLIITVLYFIVGTRDIVAPWSCLLPLGTSSLISYTIGNVILNLLGDMPKQVNLFAFLVAFFVCVLLLTKYIHRLPFYDRFKLFFTLRFLFK